MNSFPIASTERFDRPIMGIRFLCESCLERLNVKAEQAGKRGKCPHCGDTILIPLESTIVARRRKSAPDNSDAQPTVQFSKTQPFEPDELNDQANSSPDCSPAATIDNFSIPSNNDDGDSDDSISLTSDTPPAEGHDSFLLGKPKNPAVGPNSEDPIEAAPDQIWYVRHPRKREVGPVSGIVLRKMLDDGEISAGSYVWRGDWQDWEKIASVFPGRAIPETGSGSSNPGKTKRGFNLDRPATGKPNRLGLLVAIVVGIATISALIYWLIRTFS